MIRLLMRLFTLGGLIIGGWLLWQHYMSPMPPAPPPAPLPPLTGSIDRIEIRKSERKMVLYRGDEALRTYRISLGFAPEGDKVQEGDGKTPLGRFRIDRRNDKSAYHLSLGIDYPQQEDREIARAKGVSPGGDIFIHGQPNKLGEAMTLRGDWTAGCVALSNEEIREVWEVTPIGTPVEILP